MWAHALTDAWRHQTSVHTVSPACLCQVVVEGGAAVICPSHIRLGEVIWVNIEEGSYLGKAS